MQLPVNNSSVTVLEFVPSMNWHVDNMLVWSFMRLGKTWSARSPPISDPVRMATWLSFISYMSILTSIHLYVKCYSQFALNSGAQDLAGFPPQWSPCWKRVELHYSWAKNTPSLDNHSKAAIYFIYFLQAVFICFCVCVKVICRRLKYTVIFFRHMVFMGFHQKIPSFFRNWGPMK